MLMVESETWPGVHTERQRSDTLSLHCMPESCNAGLLSSDLSLSKSHVNFGKEGKRRPSMREAELMSQVKNHDPGGGHESGSASEMAAVSSQK
eukprot:2174831-Amphidinium_carterae.3